MLFLNWLIDLTNYYEPINQLVMNLIDFMIMNRNINKNNSEL